MTNKQALETPPHHTLVTALLKLGRVGGRFYQLLYLVIISKKLIQLLEEGIARFSLFFNFFLGEVKNLLKEESLAQLDWYKMHGHQFKQKAL